MSHRVLGQQFTDPESLLSDAYSALGSNHVKAMTGDCHRVAHHIHQQTGWPMIAAYASEPSEDGDGDDEGRIRHIGVVSDRGTVIDAQGEEPLSDWASYMTGSPDPEEGFDYDLLKSTDELKSALQSDSESYNRRWSAL